MITYHTNYKIPEAVLAEAQTRANRTLATQYLVYERAGKDEPISIVTTCPAVGLIAEVTSSEGAEEQNPTTPGAGNVPEDVAAEFAAWGAGLRPYQREAFRNMLENAQELTPRVPPGFGKAGTEE